MKVRHLFILLCLCSASLKAYPQDTLRFLYKTPFDTSSNRYGQHIAIREKLLIRHAKADELVMISHVDDRAHMSRAKFTPEERIALFRELLSFQHDTSLSNKFYFFIRRGEGGLVWKRPRHTADFTVEVEALFSLTRMFTFGLPPLEPVILDKRTGEVVNRDPKRMDEIYGIYRKWLKGQEETGFTNMSWPLENTPYMWKGEEDDKSAYFKTRLL
jgi:hypothetical protein